MRSPMLPMVMSSIGHDEAVDIHDPQLLGSTGCQFGADPRGGHEEDREVHGGQQCRQDQNSHAEPLAGPGFDWCVQ